MLITVLTYKKYSQSVHLLKNPQNGKYHVMHETKDGASEFPVQYDDGRIAYDFPGQVSKAIKPFIELCFIAKKAIEFINRVNGWHGYDPKDKKLVKVLFALQESKEILISEVSTQFMAVK